MKTEPVCSNLTVSSGRLEKPRVEPATTGLQGVWYHCAMEASQTCLNFPVGGNRCRPNFPVGGRTSPNSGICLKMHLNPFFKAVIASKYGIQWPKVLLKSDLQSL